MSFFCIHCRSEIDPKYKACPFCGEPITDFLRKYLDVPLAGKYQILARLGVGGMGEVYKALHIHLNAIRVIKLMRSTIAGDEGAHDRFQREARMATRIQHPNVATLFDFDTLDDGSRYMVWEHIEGINLHELIDERGPLSPRYAARISVQALAGLDAIHRAGIVHRDVSPENLMIARDEEGDEHVKIIDLGIAKQWGEDNDNKTKTGMFVGKWKYCSPEHLGMLTEGERIDGRADIYSFGIVLYEMLTGVPPFQADTPHGYLMSHASERPRALRDVNPSVNVAPELEALIFRALEKDRRKRFATARDFARAVEALIPLLPDEPGAKPGRVASEETDPATRVSAKPVDRRTLAVDQAATTVQTLSGHPAQKELSVLAEPLPEPRRSNAGWLLAAAAAVVIAVIAVIIARKPELAPVDVTPKSIATAHLGVNAFPWAEVTSVRNLADGRSLAIAQHLVTPAPFDLPPGKYELTLQNPQFQNPITQTVELKAGQDRLVTVQFADPRKVELPQFEGAR